MDKDALIEAILLYGHVREDIGEYRTLAANATFEYEQREYARKIENAVRAADQHFMRIQRMLGE